MVYILYILYICQVYTWYYIYIYITFWDYSRPTTVESILIATLALMMVLTLILMVMPIRFKNKLSDIYQYAPSESAV